MIDVPPGTVDDLAGPARADHDACGYLEQPGCLFDRLWHRG